jgi:hypothetical protein
MATITNFVVTISEIYSFIVLEAKSLKLGASRAVSLWYLRKRIYPKSPSQLLIFADNV